MSLRLDKDTGNFYSKLRPDYYYFKKASEGQLFDLFDINPVAGKKPGGRFATNVNISPNQFNRAFVGIQPQFKQTPPRLSFSTIAVFNPS